MADCLISTLNLNTLANLTIHYLPNETTYLLESSKHTLFLMVVNQTFYVADGTKIPHIAFADFRDNTIYIQVAANITHIMKRLMKILKIDLKLVYLN